ncbi:putative siderophore biosynthesis protein SbnA [Shimia thalassica]|uniref:Putative siderophore biosynthesis protein SbnA n=1 Tax=Shimia thalassica TaxID=1715693 RepID=A0A0P1IFY4_9RHOB|nr:pyridoxal-phosphate dependent enzyme [Shimia thalassica]CUK10512.1 putative siderophore biosynthesis protein SbnA [Shimia thalassica]
MRHVRTEITQDHANMRILPLFGDTFGALAFGVMKVLPAAAILGKGLQSGEISADTTIVETTSGTMGYGLAVVCNQLGLPLTLVGDSGFSAEFKAMLENLGAKIIIVDAPANDGNIQAVRMAEVKRILAAGNAFWPHQYNNPVNRQAYAPAAQLVCRDFGRVDILVAPTGSGGVSGGLSAPLRALNPAMKLVGVDTFNSVLFGQKLGARALRGLGNSMMPRNLLHEQFDHVHWLSANEAFQATRNLHRTTTLKRGPTSGAAYRVANFYAEKFPEKKVLAVFPDEGHRYESNVYNDAWLQANGFDADDIAEGPHKVTHPVLAKGSWSWIDWHRRSLNRVLNPSVITEAGIMP